MGVSKIEKAQHCAMKTENRYCSAYVLVQPIHRLGALLQEHGELRARQDRLSLAERLHFLVAGRLPDFEVLQREVARLVQIGVLVHELLLLIHGRLLGLLGRDLVRLGRRLLLGLVRDVTRLLLDRFVRVLHVRLVSLLGVGLSLDRLSLQRLRVPHDLLKHAHDTAGARGLLVLLEARRRRRAHRLLLRGHLEELLREDGREHIVRLLEERLRLALVRNRGLEVLVLHLAVLTRALELRLHLRDLRLQGRDGLGQLINRRREVRDLGLELRDVTGLELRLALVRVQALGAEVLVLDLVRLLLQERRDHLIDGRLNLRERVEAHASRERSQARVAVGLGGLEEERRSLVAVLAVLRLHLRLHEVEGAREGVVRVIARQDGERLAHGLDLLSPCLLALLPLLVRHLASLLQVHEELLVRREGVPRVLEVLLRLRELLVRVRELLRLRVLELRSGLDLGLLRRLEVLVCGLRLHLLLLGRAQVRLEGLLHLLEDPEDLARLRRVALLEGRLRVEVVTRRLHERGDRLALGRRHCAHEHVLVLLELVVDDSGHVQERFGRHLSERLRVVLGEDDDGRLERTDGLEHVLLLLVELGELLLAHRGRLVERLLVLRDFRLKVLDLRVQARAHGRQLLDRRREVGDAGLGLCDGRRLLLVVRLAPARNLFVSLLVLLGLLLELSLHILEQVDDLGHRTVLFVASNVSGRAVQRKSFHSGEGAKESKHCVNVDLTFRRYPTPRLSQ